MNTLVLLIPLIFLTAVKSSKSAFFNKKEYHEAREIIMFQDEGMLKLIKKLYPLENKFKKKSCRSQKLQLITNDFAN